MVKYIFILGKNWRLALAEIDQYLQTKEFRGQIVDYSATAAIVDFESAKVSIDAIGDLMIRLGSVQKIAKVLDFISTETLHNAFPVEIEENRAMVFSGRRYLDNTLKDIVYELFPEIKDKSFLVASSIYPQEFQDAYYKEILVPHFLHYVNKFFNNHLKELGAKKALYYKYPQKNIEKGNLNPIFPHHFLTYRLYEPTRAEIIYAVTDAGMFVGKTITVVDSNFQKQLDEERPYKEFRQTIPPKFAKTLISFLQLEGDLKQKKILDPLCGSGTILQFALITGLQVYGSDIDPKQVQGTRKNIAYTSELLEIPISKKYLQEHVITTDVAVLSEKFEPMSFDGIASEPVLLPFYREQPEYATVRQVVINDVEPIYKKLIQQSFSLLKSGGKLAFVAPIIHASNGERIGVPIADLAEKTGFKMVQLLRQERFNEKENPRLALTRPPFKTIVDQGTKHLIREFYLLVKP